MRKISLVLLVVTLVISICGCRKDNNTSSNDTSSINESSIQSITSTVSSEEVNSVESNESSSSSKQIQAPESTISKKQNTSTTASTTSSMGHGQSAPDPVSESLNWTSLAGKWEFVTTDPSRLQGAAYYMLSFDIDSENATTIHTGGYILPDGATYDIWSEPSHEFDGKIYYRDWGGDLYSGNFMITQGEEDRPILELRCYDGPGQNFMTDELKFKRLDNNTLQYVGDDFAEFQLRTGDVFKR